jgi:flap endonuclease-1
MGIKNMLKFLNNFDGIVKELNHDNYNYERVAIDISIVLYQVIISIRNTGADLTNQQGDITSHILGLFNRTINLLKKNIIPIYVFDGKPPEFKNKVLEQRKNIKKKAYEKLEEAETKEEKIKYLKKTVSISKKQLQECKELLALMGIPYVEAPEEADSQCSYLVKMGLADSVMTEDMDILTFGSNKIYRNLSSFKKNTLEIRLDNILKKIDLSYEQFIDLCILFGCDYSDKIKNINPEIIYQYYYKFKNIENTLKELKNDGYTLPEFSNHKIIKEYFISCPHKEINYNDVLLKQSNINDLENILIHKYGLIKIKIMPKINFLKNFYLKKIKNI